MKKTKLLAILLSLIALWSCKEDSLEETPQIISTEISKENCETSPFIPYASTKTLDFFAKDKDLIHYSFARKLALIELQNSDFIKKMKWDGYTISERPVIIYGFDSKPKFFEFFMKDAEKKEQGTVKVSARRNIPNVLEELSNTIKDYQKLYPKASLGMKIIEDWTGNLYTGIIGKSGESVSSPINIETGEIAGGRLEEISESEIFDKIADNIERAEQEFFLNYDSFENPEAAKEIKKDEISGGLQEQMDALKEEIEEEQIAREKYWNIVEECKDSIMTLSDAEIKEIYSKNWLSRQWKKLIGVRTSSKYELPKFRNNLTYRQKGYTIPVNAPNWCGP